MSTNESLTSATDLSAEQAITIQPSGVAAYGNAGDWPTGEADGGQTAAYGAAALLHSLRRHWLVIVAGGIAASTVMLLCTSWIFPTYLHFMEPKYEAVATLIVQPSETPLIKSMADNNPVPDEFEIFRKTQAALIKEPFVLTAALRTNRKLKDLPSIQAEDARHNAVNWLKSVVDVDKVEKSGLMKVSVKLPSAQEASAIANAVVDAYMTEVVNRERLSRRSQMDSLRTIADTMEIDIRKKRDDLRQFEGGGDEQNGTMKQQLATSVYLDYLRELQRVQWEKTALVGKRDEAVKLGGDIAKTLDEKTNFIQDPKAVKVSEIELATVLNADPGYHDAMAQKRQLEIFYNSQIKLSVKGKSLGLQHLEEQVKSLNDLIDGIKSDSAKKLLQAKAIDLEEQVRRMSAEIDTATNQVTLLQHEADKARSEVEAMGHPAVDVLMARAELENKERIYHSVAQEREKLAVELDQPARVSVLGDPPTTPPETETGFGIRLILIVAASLGAFCLPGLGLVVWDIRKERVNSPDEVGKKLKLSVMGALPYIPPSVMRKLGSPTRRSQIWKTRYTEAVHGIVARLLRNAECDDTRVVLVTSAMNGEGKTWLATQVAMGLARAQRRTVLVDFDLRHPALDGALGLPLGPGLCEALRGEGDVAAMVQSTDNQYLSVVTAGSWSREIPPTLANGGVGELLDRLRENFDFVIVDSSPLLPVVDTRHVCQYVDGVLLSVLRDVSESGKVRAAQEMLDAFGVSKVYAVVTGGEHYGNAKSLLFHGTMAGDEVELLTDERSAPQPASGYAAEPLDQRHQQVDNPPADGPRNEN